jgi:hypothetical protein
MAILGLLGLLQIVILPGYLLLRALRIGTGIVATCVLAFALSLVANHVLVAGLVVLGIYRPAVLYAVFAAELAAVAVLDGPRLRAGIVETSVVCGQRMHAFFRDIEHSHELAVNDSSLTLRFGMCTVLAAALVVIVAFTLTGLSQAGEIFQQWDAVVSWNRWAADWAANHLPASTSIYPQLLPTNCSLSYVFLQSSQIWIFAKGFQFLFCVMLLLAMLDLARIDGRFGYLPGVLITYVLLAALLRFRMLSSGYADVPLAYFALVSVYALLRARSTADTLRRKRLLILGALLAFGAAATKQTGLYLAAIYPLLAWRLVLCGEGQGSFRRNLPLLAGIGLILALTISPWYLYKVLDFHAGCDKNNTALLMTDFHQQRQILERLSYGGSLIVEAITPLGAGLVVLAIAASLKDPVQRWLVGTLVAPLGLIWAIAFSYDLRNLAIIVPFVGAAAGTGLMHITAWINALCRSGEARKPCGLRESLLVSADSSLSSQAVSNSRTLGSGLCVGHVIGLLSLLLVAAGLYISDERLMRQQLQQQRMVGMPELNCQLYAYAAEHPQATIATDYQAMRWLPELGEKSVVCSCCELTGFRLTFDRPEIDCVLVRTAGAANEVRNFLQSQAAAKLVFESHGFRLYEKRSDTAPKVAAVR